MKTFFLTMLLTAASGMLRAQNMDDLHLIDAHSSFDSAAYRQYRRPGNSATLMQVHHSGALAQYNPVSLFFRGAMFAYQHVLSPQLSSHCPYQITCSNFSKQAIGEFGLVKGLFLSADRITRCTRIGLMDVHPINFAEDGTIIDPPNLYKW